MRALRGVLVCVALCFAGGAAAVHADESALFVTIHLQVDRAIPSRLLTGVLEEEAAAIWRPYGVHIRWTAGSGSETAVHGLCLEARLQPRIEGAGLPQWSAVLGTASVEIEAPSVKPMRVSYDATQELLAQAANHPATAGRLANNRELARALGRVLAHEIGHVLLGAPYHETAGLMRAVYRPDELAGQDSAPFRLTCVGVARLRSRVRVLRPKYLDPSDDTGDDRLEPASCVATTRVVTTNN